MASPTEHSPHGERNVEPPVADDRVLNFALQTNSGQTCMRSFADSARVDERLVAGFNVQFVLMLSHMKETDLKAFTPDAPKGVNRNPERLPLVLENKGVNAVAQQMKCEVFGGFGYNLWIASPRRKCQMQKRRNIHLPPLHSA